MGTFGARHALGPGLATVVASMVLATGATLPATAENILQNGDILIGGARVVNSFGEAVGRLYRWRNGVVETVFDGAQTPGLGPISWVIIDGQSRVVFATPACGGNSNSSAIWRLDLSTGVAQMLACFPYVVTPDNLPPGLPPEASNFYLLSTLYLTRSLRIRIDDDVQGGLPQVGFTEGYGCGITVTIDGQTRPRAFRYVTEDNRFEDDVALDLLENGYPDIVIENGSAWYSNGGQIGRAEPRAVLDFAFDGDLGHVSGRLVISGRNELVMSHDILDNRLVPNFSAKCGEFEGENIPELGFWVLSGLTNIGFVGGGLFATSNSGAAGRPYLFNLARRAPFLNPYCCCFVDAVEYDGPVEFYQGKDVDVAIGDGGRILGTQRFAGNLVSVRPSGEFEVLASGLVNPVGIAAYPPPGDVQSARNLTIRIDEPVGHVLLTDPDGRRIGHTPDGTPINEFGDRGAIVDPGEPGGFIRAYTVSSPAAGLWTIRVAGIADAPYTLRGYLADVSEGGTMATIDGAARMDGTHTFDAIVTPPLGLVLRPRLWPDADGDGDVDADDFGAFQRCWTRTGVSLLPGHNCLRFNRDGDLDIDSDDYSRFELCRTAPSVPLNRLDPPPGCSP